MLYHGVTLGGTERYGQTSSDCPKGALISAHAQVIGPIEMERKPKLGRVRWLYLMCLVM